MNLLNVAGEKSCLTESTILYIIVCCIVLRIDESPATYFLICSDLFSLDCYTAVVIVDTWTTDILQSVGSALNKLGFPLRQSKRIYLLQGWETKSNRQSPTHVTSRRVLCYIWLLDQWVTSVARLLNPQVIEKSTVPIKTAEAGVIGSSSRLNLRNGCEWAWIHSRTARPMGVLVEFCSSKVVFSQKS